MTHFSSKVCRIGYAFAAAAVLGIASFSAAAQDQTAPTTGSHIDPNARPVMLPPVQAGGAIEAAKAVPLDASEARAQHPKIGEIDAAEWLPADTDASK